jgi:hypothetical protein
MKTNKTMRGQEVLNLRRRKVKKSESHIDLAAHKQIPEQQKQRNGRTHYIPINSNTKCQWTQLPNQKTLFDKLD